MALLGMLPEGSGFELKVLNAVGIIDHHSGGETRCRVLRDGQISSVSWSPHTEVISRPVELKEEKSAGQDLTCVCGKVCSSKSGMTLHQKTCQSC